MITVDDLPTVNATLNAASAVLLLTGFVCIRFRRVAAVSGNGATARWPVAAHRAAMVGAFLCSTLFLVSYLMYHAQVGSVRFPGQGWIRFAYLGVLLTHTVLAVLIVPMALRTLYLAVRGQYVQHRMIARWTLPVWLYVSVTGVLIYWLLYRSPWGVRA